MKKTLMATVAAAALFAGTSLAMAEGVTKDQGGAKSGATEMHRGGAEMNKGAESKGAAESKSHGQTTGQGSGMENRAESRTGKSENKAESKEMKRSGQAEEKGQSHQRTGQAEQKGSRSTTGQATPGEKSQMGKEGSSTNKNQAQELNKNQSPSNRNQAQENRQQPSSQSAQGRSSTTTGQGAATSTQAGGAVNLTSQQRTELRTSVIEKSSAPKISRSQINFNLAVGTVVPRSGVVHFVDVPETLIHIHPAWRGYKYFVVDEEIIIVEPSSYKIVAVLDV